MVFNVKPSAAKAKTCITAQKLAVPTNPLMFLHELPALFIYLNRWLYLDMSSKTPVCTQLFTRAVSQQHRDNRLSSSGPL